MRGRVATAAAVVAVAALGGCGGGGGARSGHGSPAPAPAATSTPGGLVGAIVGTIDQARVEAVCENARQADTAVQTGTDSAQVDQFVSASVSLLERPPVVSESQTLAARLTADVRSGHRDAAVAALDAFCAAHRG